MRKIIASLATSAMLLGGAAAVTLSPAGAQDEEAPSEEAPDERPERGTRLREALDGLVSLGVLTQEQSDTVFDTLMETLSSGDHTGGRHGGGGAALGTAAEAIGIEVEDLREAVRDGSTIAEIAEENGVDAQEVIDALVAQANERIDQALADGRFDEAEADEKRAEVEQRVTDLVNGDLERPERPGGPNGGPPSGGPDGDGNSEDTADA